MIVVGCVHSYGMGCQAALADPVYSPGPAVSTDNGQVVVTHKCPVRRGFTRWHFGRDPAPAVLQVCRWNGGYVAPGPPGAQASCQLYVRVPIRQLLA